VIQLHHKSKRSAMSLRIFRAHFREPGAKVDA
jgi:hypothetical protein